MESTQQPTAEIDFAASFPGLLGLGLSIGELNLLRRQGNLERRGSQPGTNRGYWRLRYRNAGSVKTVYVGCDLRRVAQIRDELRELQAARHRQLELRSSVRKTSQVIRNTKRGLAPVLAQRGFHFHGDRIRKRRLPKIKLD